MTQQVINVGTAANDGTGDTLRAAYQKTNSNFAELYATAAPFNPAITFNGRKVLPRREVAAALAFTVDATDRFLFGSTYATLVSNGSIVPTFAGMQEWGGSAGWDNTAGVINRIEFFWDGDDYFYNVSQAVNGARAPYVVSVSGTPGTNTIDLNYSANLATPAPAASAFTISSNGAAISVTGVAIGTGKVTLTVNRNLVSNENITLGYTAPAPNPITSATGGVVAGSWSGLVFTVTGTQQFVRFTLGSGTTETVNGSGYNYSKSAANWGQSSVGQVSIPAGQDGFFGFTQPASPFGVGAGTLGTFFGIHTANASLASWSSLTAGAYGGEHTQNSWSMTGFTSAGASAAARLVEAGDVARIRRTGTSLIFEVSKNGGSTYTTIGTATAPTGQLFLHLFPGQPGYGAVLPFASLNAAA